MNQELRTNVDLDLERQVLSTVLAYPEAMKHTEGLKATDFADEAHRLIFSEMRRQLNENERPSPASVGLKIGNPAYFASLMTTPALLEIAHAVDILIELSARRAVEWIAKGAVYSLENGASSAEAIQQLSPLTSGELLEPQTRKMHDSGKVSRDILADLDRAVFPFKTGLEKLDEAMAGGMYPKKAYGIAARKKVGKTIMLGTISHNLNMDGVKHLFICGEMGEKEIQQRVLCRALGLFPSAFRTGYAERPMVMQRLQEYTRTAPKNTLYLDSPGITFDKLKHAVTTAYMRYGIKGFILDYWQLVAGKSGRDSEAFHLGEVAQWIAEIGRKLDIWSLTAAQINQDGNTRGGEGMRLAFDQVYHMQPLGDGDGDITLPGRWLEMMDTRYTPWMNVGDRNYAGVVLNEKGLFFE